MKSLKYLFIIICFNLMLFNNYFNCINLKKVGNAVTNSNNEKNNSNSKIKESASAESTNNANLQLKSLANNKSSSNNEKSFLKVKNSSLSSEVSENLISASLTSEAQFAKDKRLYEIQRANALAELIF